MSLNWEVSEIKDYKNVCWEPIEDSDKVTLNVTTHSLIYATMPVGIGRITEDNYKEFFVRVGIIEELVGTFMNEGPNPVKFTLEDIKNHIGLSTNVSFLERSEWLAGYLNNSMDSKIRYVE